MNFRVHRRFDCVSLKKNSVFHFCCDINTIKFIKHSLIHRLVHGDIGISFRKGQILHPTGRNIKAASSKAAPEIKASCVLFASVRETKYWSNISKPVGNVFKTNLDDLIKATEWNHLVWNFSGIAAAAISFQWLTTSDGGGGNHQKKQFCSSSSEQHFQKA